MIRSDEGQDIIFRLVSNDDDAASNHKSPELRISSLTGVTIKDVGGFKLVDPHSGRVRFDLSDPRLTLSAPLETLAASELLVSEVSTPLGRDLFVKSDGGLEVQFLASLEFI